MSLKGRQRECLVFGSSRSAEILSRSKLVTCERLLLLSLTFSPAWAKVKFQGRPVARCEIGHGQQWVGSGQPIRWTRCPKPAGRVGPP